MFELYVPAFMQKLCATLFGKDWALSRADIALQIACQKGESKDYINAYKYFTLALKYAPEGDNIYAQRGLCYVDLEMYKEAEAEFKKALEINAKNHIAYFGLGRLYASYKQTEEAIKHYKKSQQLEKNNDSALFNIACIYINSGLYITAIPFLEQAFDINPSIYLINNLVFCLLEVGKLQDAEFYIAYADKTYIEDAYLYRNKAILQLAKQNYTEALQCLKKAAQLGFEEQYGTEVQDLIIQVKNNTYTPKVYIDSSNGDKPNLQNKDWTHHRIDETSAENLFALAFKRQKQGAFLDAIDFYKKGLKLDDSNLDNWANLAYCYIRIKNYKLTLQTLEYILKFSMPDEWILSTQGIAYNGLSLYQDALVSYGYCAELFRDTPNPYIGLAYTYLKLKDYGKALTNAQKALDIDLQSPVAWSHLGVAYLYLNNLEKANDAMNMGFKYSFDESYLYKNRALYFIMVGDTITAIDFLLQAQKLNYKELYDNEVEDLLLSLGYTAPVDKVEESKPIQKLSSDQAIIDQTANSHFKAGYYEHSKKNYKQAIKHYENCLAIASNWVVAWNNLGFAYIEDKQYEQAKPCLEKALRLDNNHAFALDNLGFVYLQLGEYEQAKIYMDKSQKADPTNCYVYKNQALLQLALGNKTASIVLLKKAKLLGYTEQYDTEVDDLLKQLSNTTPE